MAFLLRVALPDRPGSLGQLATALGTVGADIEAIEVVERRFDRTAVDDVLVGLPPGALPDSLVSACRSVPGIVVEWISRFAAGGGLFPDLEAVEVMTQDPTEAAARLVDVLPTVFRTDWAAVVSRSAGSLSVEYATPAAPGPVRSAVRSCRFQQGSPGGGPRQLDATGGGGPAAGRRAPGDRMGGGPRRSRAGCWPWDGAAARSSSTPSWPGCSTWLHWRPRSRRPPAAPRGSEPAAAPPRGRQGCRSRQHGGVSRPLPDFLDPGWALALAPVADEIAAAGDFLRAELAAGRTYLPPGAAVLRAFTQPFDEVRVLIVGQDPYPTPGHAVGLSFSVAPEVRPIPRSLGNIFREYSEDLDLPRPATGDLTPWARHGVLLLNRVLTVAPGAPASHRGHGWEAVTEQAIRALVDRAEPLVAILWGRDAATLGPLLADVPADPVRPPLPDVGPTGGSSARSPFSRANAELLDLGAEEVDWRLP